MTNRLALRRMVRASVTAMRVYYVLDDWRARRRLARHDIATTSGARHVDIPLAESLNYIEQIYADYLVYADRAAFSGTVAEIGPGDNFGLALLLLKCGADWVHAIDRYHSQRNAGHQAAIYEALAARHDLSDLFDGNLVEGTLRRLSYHAGLPAERFFREHDIRFDAILSRAVMEHLYDPLAALDDMAAAMAPGGIMIHRIDLRDHGMFAGHHPLTFLTSSERLHKAMTRGSGRPNRVLLPEWRQWLAGSGLHGSLRITRLAGIADEIAPASWDEVDTGLREQALACVREIRLQLPAPLKDFTDDDLAVAGCVLVAQKPWQATEMATSKTDI
ncbi:MAG: methyltransferase domain-containing protein [Alphaproteobacteria bacterium]|nr:methyltransferase domain-containing protein [Alphaproteobacteria bacterium]MDP7235088.1 methyltransferase domain-containing protein [Alphaproteobacteria bacterium]MDP7487912.1 methyltransferase domain-containing protein [Alphaproteobacteria bacterium]MDP7540618.1 methyltransferase domain-containing protein [Alphaproteobacteria bacterium]HJN20699.1 methyltransferase domain-containing protein [Alphaproteobacteria bacterium]